jgi:hypothetical protein
MSNIRTLFWHYAALDVNCRPKLELLTMRKPYLICIAMVGACTSAHAALAIRNTPTKNVSCSAGVCTSTAKNAVLNADQLKTMLASSSVRVRSEVRAEDIVADALLSWTNGSRLTLDSRRSITFERPVTVAGPGALTLTTNRGGSGGELTFNDAGSVTFWDLSSSLIIDGAKYKLVNSLATLADAFSHNTYLKCALANNYNAKQDGAYTAPVPTLMRGVFQGLGHTISNLQITGERRGDTWAGLFARGSGGTYASVHLAKISVRTAEITEYNTWVGAVVGTDEGGKIFNVTVSGTVSAQGEEENISAGGLAGSIGEISESSSSANVSVAGFGDESGIVGGLAGDGWGSTTRSHASGSVGCQIDPCVLGGLVGDLEPGASVTSSDASGPVILTGNANGSAGGLVGEIQGYTGYDTEITYSHASGAISAPQADAGGLVGYAYDAVIRQSFAIGNVSTGSGSAAGLVGGISGESSIVDSYSLGPVQAGPDSNIGGLVGYCDANGSTINTSYAISHISGGTSPGGFLGDDTGSGGLSSDYWDLDTSGIGNPSQGAGNVPNDPGITGLTDSQLKSGLPAGFDPAIWAQSASINNGYPYLIANPPQ